MAKLRNKEPQYHPWVHRLAWVTAASTLLLIVAGALVTSNDAGLSVPDWPLSYGTWMPPMVGGILYEHGHRMIGTWVGFLTLFLAISLWRMDARGWVRRLGFVALGAVVLQGVLGGITVLYLLPWPVSVGHASLAQAFFCLTVSLAVFTGKRWPRAPEQQVVKNGTLLPTLAVATVAAVFLQLVMGAMVRHQVVGVAAHLAGALLVAALVVWSTSRVFRSSPNKEIQRPALAVASLTSLQLVLGTVTYFARRMTADFPQPEPVVVALTVAHVTVGALLLASTVVFALQTHRLIRPQASFASLRAAGQESAL